MKKIIFIVAITLVFVSCKKEEETIQNSDTNSDLLLYEKAKITSNFTWYKNVDSLFKKSSGRGL
jgi:PBP1b-binding outer membrane lipoprotein LpoB